MRPCQAHCENILSRPILGPLAQETHMADKIIPGPDDPREVKVYFSLNELKVIDAFREEFTIFTSRNQLFHMAIEFYMTKTRESGAVMRKGHPTSTPKLVLEEMQRPRNKKGGSQAETRATPISRRNMRQKAS